jgi:EAL domain-containing protein (putative c-di-GMP-specific phosphodiesterase class I)
VRLAVDVDLVFIRGVDDDPARRAFVSSLVTFAAGTGAAIVVEGIETVAELETLRELGARRGQGDLIGRPAPAEDRAVAAPLTPGPGRPASGAAGPAG